MSSFETNPKDMKDLLVDIQAGKIQLPDFQRGWVWEDMRIRGLLVSVAQSFPMGAVFMSAPATRAGEALNPLLLIATLVRRQVCEWPIPV